MKSDQYQDELVQTATSVVHQCRITEHVEAVIPLHKGYSQDKKCILRVEGESKYLLRLSDVKLQARRLSEFELLGDLRRHGVLCPRPVQFGTSPDGKFCFQLVTYIAGEPADEELPRLSRGQQYEIGLQAGQELRKLHALANDHPPFDMHSFCQKRMANAVAGAQELGLGFEGQAGIEQYVQDNLWHLKNRPTVYVHEDYHPGNLIVRDGQFAGVIDFNRSMWGDPHWDFFKMPLLTCNVSRPFARGQIEGYFPNGADDGFWLHYNVYVALSLHISLVWSFKNDRQSLGLWQQRIPQIVQTHDFQSSGPPQWYLAAPG